MASKKKFGAFAGGVFTPPSLLTILGVIMYLRMGWVVGNAGLIGTLAIILLAHVISISTGLSISSIATDKKSRCRWHLLHTVAQPGHPNRWSDRTYFVYWYGFFYCTLSYRFCRKFQCVYGFADTVNGLRITGTIALLALTAIALISTSVAIKTQFFLS